MRWTVSEHETGLSVEEWLQARLPQAPAGYLRQLINRGRIRSAGGPPLAAGDELRAGSEISLPDSQRLLELVAAGESSPCIIRETEHWVVSFKPAGLAVHPGQGHEQDNLTDRLQNFYRQGGAPFRVSPVHRLDLGTSGPVLFGKGRQAIGQLGKVFMAGRTSKHYLALAEGHLRGCGTLDTPLTVDGKEKSARTHFRTLRLWEDCCLLFLTLDSGRQHQIRRQLAIAGHPLIGDQRYGSRHARQLGRPFLHHCRLVFFDPWSEQNITITASLPQDLSCLLRNRKSLF